MYPFHRKAVAPVLVLAGVMSFWLMVRWEAVPSSEATSQVAAAYAKSSLQLAQVEPPASVAAAVSPGQLCRPVLMPGAGPALQCQAVAARTITTL